MLLLQETTENNQEIETMKQQLQTYLKKEQENQEAADKQAAHQIELMKEIAELKQQLETEQGDVGKLREDVNNLTLERDACKRKIEKLEMQPEESKVGILLKIILRALCKHQRKKEKTNTLFPVLAFTLEMFYHAKCPQ